MFRCIFQAVKINLNLLFLQSIGNPTYIDLFAKLRTPSPAHTYSVDVPLICKAYYGKFEVSTQVLS